MAEYDSLDPRAGEEPVEQQRRRRLLSLREMTGNPFLPDSPMEDRGTPHQPYTLDELGVPPLAQQQATSMNLRGGTPQPQAAPVAAPPPAAYGGGGGTSSSATTRSLTSIPTQGPQASREPKDYRAGVHKAMGDLDEQMKMPDMGAQAQAYQRRYEGAGPDLVLGMMMADRGGESGRQFGGQIFKQALARRQPEKTDYGTFDETGFTADPMKMREFNISRAEKKIAMLETIARDSENADERRFAREQANLLRRDALEQNRLLRQDAMQNQRYMTVKDVDGSEVIFDKQTQKVVTPGGGAGGAPGQPGQPGPEKLPKLNDSQGKAVAFGMRAAQSAAQLEKLGTDYSYGSVAAKGALERIPGVGPVAGAGYNLMMGPQEQLAEQAQRNFINAVLRRESGAVINPDEFANARQQYFPQPGDSAAVLKQKKINRDTSIRGLMIEAGPGARFVQQVNAPKLPPRALPQATRPQGSLDERKQSYLEQAGGDDANN